VRKIELDELEALKGIKHPDVLLVLDDGAVIVVEETKRPRSEDIDKLLSLLEFLRDDWTPLLGHRKPSAITCVVHHTKSDVAFYIRIRAKDVHKAFRRHGAGVRAVRCRRLSELEQRLRITFGKGK